MKILQKYKKIYIGLLFVLLFVPMKANAYENNLVRMNASEKEKKVISVIYDDSRSMVNHPKESSKWVEANYAVKAIATMMEAGDELRTYPMGNYKEEKRFIIENEAEKEVQIDSVGKELQEVIYREDTCSSAIEEALSDFENDENENWIIILTDGIFNKPKRIDSEDKLKKSLLENIRKSEQNTRIIYIPIGEDAITPKFENDSEIIVINDENDETIIKQITNAMNRIYGRAELKSDDILENKDGRVEVDLNIPLRKVIAFVQYRGKEDKLSIIQEEIKNVDNLEVTMESVPDYFVGMNEIGFMGELSTPKSEKYGEIKDTKGRILQGYVLSWNGNIENYKNKREKISFKFSKGEFSADNEEDLYTEIYYEPAVQVYVEYFHNGEPVQHIDECENMRAEKGECCIRGGEISIVLHLRDMDGNEISVSEPFLREDDRHKYEIKIIPKDGSEPIDMIPNYEDEMRFSAKLGKGEYELYIKTPWNEEVQEKLNIQREEKELDIFPVSGTEVIKIDSENKEERMLMLEVKEDGQVCEKDSLDKISISPLYSGDIISIENLGKNSNGQYSLLFTLKEKSLSSIDEKLILPIQIENKFSEYLKPDNKIKEMELTLETGPYTLEARVKNQEKQDENNIVVGVDAWKCMLIKQKIPLEYIIKETGQILSEKELKENFEIEINEENDSITVNEKGILTVKRGFWKWLKEKEREETITLSVSGKILTNEIEQQKMNIIVEITPVPEEIKTLIYVIVGISTVWIALCVLQSFSKRHIKKESYVLRSKRKHDESPARVTLKRKANLFVPFFNAAFLIRNKKSKYIPDFKLKFKNTDKGKEIINWNEFSDGDLFKIGGYPVTKLNRIICSDKQLEVCGSADIWYVLEKE